MPLQCVCRAISRLRLTLAFLALACWLGALPVAPTHTERSTDGDEELLPINETEAERALGNLLAPRLLAPRARASDPPPVGPIRNVAEFEPCTGVLIRYPLGLPYSLIREMTRDVTVHVIVSSENYGTAVANFNAEGVDTSRVEWVVAPNNSIWTRDYGPWFVFDGNGKEVILDHFYNRPTRPDDDQIPIVLGAKWGIPVVTHTLWHTGGNYMSEGHGLSYSTDLVWYENPSMSHSEIAQFMRDYYGVGEYQVLPDISPDGIHHIDTWAKLLDEETVLVKQVDASHPDYGRIEATAATIAGLTDKYGRPFRVARVFCPPIPSGDVAAYTNSLILNNRVFVPNFNTPAADAAALEVYRNSMPGYEVIGVDGSWLSQDALHCRVMGIHDRYMLRVDHNPVQQAGPGLPVPITMYADDRSEAGLDMTFTKLYWRQAGASAFTAVPFVPTSQPDWYEAQIPAQPPLAKVEYYVTARDLTGRTASRPRPAPYATYRFSVSATASAGTPDGASNGNLELTTSPTPFQSGAVVRFRLGAAGPVRLAVYDVRGREVARLVERSLPAGAHKFEWSGQSANGAPAPSGVYFVLLKAAGERASRRVVLIR